MDPPPKMGKLAQRFNLSQRKRKQEQAAVSDRSGNASFQASQVNPVQLPGSEVLRRAGSSDAQLGPASMSGGSLDGPRHRHFSTFQGSSELPPKISSASEMSMETPTPEQGKILELEQRLRVATQRVQDLEDETKVHAEELMVARTQAKIDIDQEVVRLQQEVETLGEHEDRLIRELVASESKLKVLEATERELNKRLSHFRTIYCLKHAYRDHLDKMPYIRKCIAKRLHERFLEAETKYMAAAFELYDHLEANGLQDTISPDVKAWLAQSKNKKG